MRKVVTSSPGQGLGLSKPLKEDVLMLQFIPSTKLGAFLKRIVKKLNDGFIFLVLVVFYAVGVGVSFLILQITTQFAQKKKEDSYWQEANTLQFGVAYFASPY